MVAPILSAIFKGDHSMTCAYRVISIGTMSAHPLRGEEGTVRTSHATTTLLSIDDRQILVNPSLPPQLLESRLDERASLSLGDITDVFMTSFYPDHRRSLPALSSANWYVSEAERDAMLEFLESEQAGADSHVDQERQSLIEAERELVANTIVAPDHLAGGVDLFPCRVSRRDPVVCCCPFHSRPCSSVAMPCRPPSTWNRDRYSPVAGTGNRRWNRSRKQSRSQTCSCSVGTTRCRIRSGLAACWADQSMCPSRAIRRSGPSGSACRIRSRSMTSFGTMPPSRSTSAPRPATWRINPEDVKA